MVMVVVGLTRATLLMVVGFFILVFAQKAEGGLRLFGRYLAIWVFAIAGLSLLASAVSPWFGDGFGTGDLRIERQPGAMRAPRLAPPAEPGRAPNGD